MLDTTASGGLLINRSPAAGPEGRPLPAAFTRNAAGDFDRGTRRFQGGPALPGGPSSC